MSQAPEKDIEAGISVPESTIMAANYVTTPIRSGSVEANAKLVSLNSGSSPGSEPSDRGMTEDRSGSNNKNGKMTQRLGGGCFGDYDAEVEGDEDRGALGTGKPILIEFRDFVLGGNLIRMAVAFALALSLHELIQQFVASFITPVLGIIGASDFTNLRFTIRGSNFDYGKFINTAISFFVICSVLFFCLILPVQRYGGRCVPSWIIRKCPHCFSDMPAIATKCAHCTSDIIPLVKPLKTSMRKNN